LILIDWHMRGRDGLEVCRALRAEADLRLRGVPVILITAQIGAEQAAEGFEAGVTDYLTKPFAPAQLRARLRSWLMRARANEPDA
jgi:DNA-binding response OmpR family regulator